MCMRLDGIQQLYGRSYGGLTHQTCRCPVCWIILVEVWITTVLEQMDVGQRPEKLLCSDKLPGEEFPVAFQIPSDT